jgi:hypothetical protein
LGCCGGSFPDRGMVVCCQVETVTILGDPVVQPGRGLGAALMDDREVERLRELAGFAIVPGTLNVRLPEPLERSPSWRYLPAAQISPDWEAQSGQAGYFVIPIMVAERYRGLAFQADEPEYPCDQVELLGEVHLRGALGLSRRRPDHRLGARSLMGEHESCALCELARANFLIGRFGSRTVPVAPSTGRD